jgi:signal transduction histidine kinase
MVMRYQDKIKNTLPKLKIFHKLLISFLALSIIPLIILGYIANKDMAVTGLESITIAKSMGERNLQSAKEIGNRAIDDSVRQLDEKSTESIEQRTMDLAQNIADFLYERDRDIIMLAAFKPDAEKYLEIFLSSNRTVIVPGPWPRKAGTENTALLNWKNPENKVSWRHRPPNNFTNVSKSLYKEITYIDLNGREKIKIKNGKISDDLKDVSRQENTYCKAEDYFKHLKKLKKEEIYVSRVVGAYGKGWLYKTPKGIAVKPESAYAGKENLGGKAFDGIIRWATPIYHNHLKTGYLTLALDHIHLMGFTDHIVPTEKRFSDISDAGSGNYAFLWDDQDQCISHPRDFFICGYDTQTGKEVPGWISQDTYNEFKESGLTLDEFVSNLPSFNSFSQKKKGSLEQLKSGNISLDCRILDTAPQCQGWHRGTEDGGSGSFLILWSGLWKLTTYATVPYYTGIYGNSKRGFGYVTIGANVDDFHKAANITKANIETSILEQGRDIRETQNKSRDLIAQSISKTRNLITIITIVSALAVICVSILFSHTITRPLKRLIDGAVAMSQGDLNQHIEVKSRDEIGQLANSFNEMALAVAEVDRMKSEFVTIASHELRTPIHAMMLGVSGVLEGYSGEISEEVREDLEIVNEGIDRLKILVEGLLDLSRMEARKIELNITKESLVNIIDHAIEELKHIIETHQHVIKIDTPSNIPDLYVDAKRITQVVINLLSNSIKYTPDGGHIRIWAEKNANEIIFSIADNGYGIPSWAHEKVFEKFFQADSIMSQKVGGSGLGLIISKGIIEEHGGKIYFESPIPENRFSDFSLGDQRKGTVFTIHLPIKPKKGCSAG